LFNVQLLQRKLAAEFVETVHVIRTALPHFRDANANLLERCQVRLPRIWQFTSMVC
jgi:hypothetical protein